MTAPKYVVVPVEPDSKILSAINLAEKYYSSFVWSKILGSLPDTGMVAVRRELLHKMWKTLEKTDSFNSFSSEEEQEMIESLCGKT